MKQILLFLGLLLLFSLWSFPHHRFVETVLARPLTPLGLRVAVAKVGYAFPLGYRLGGVRLSKAEANLSVESITLQPSLRHGLDLSARACSGTIDGSLSRRRVVLRFSGLDPSDCIRDGGLSLKGRFSGELEFEKAENATRPRVPPRELAEKGRLRFQSHSGSVSGTLPAAAGKTPFSLGEWPFRDLSADARLEAGTLRVSELRALSQGVDWRLSDGRIPLSSAGSARLRAELRARATDESPRAKAVFALLPKATLRSDGWRHYRVRGSLTSPTLIGLR